MRSIGQGCSVQLWPETADNDEERMRWLRRVQQLLLGCSYLYTCIPACILSVFIRGYIYIYTHAHVHFVWFACFASLYIYPYKPAYTYTHTHIYIYMYTNLYTRTEASGCISGAAANCDRFSPVIADRGRQKDVACEVRE